MGAYDKPATTEVTSHVQLLVNARAKVFDALSAINALESFRGNMADTEIFSADQSEVDSEVAKFVAIKATIEANKPIAPAQPKI